MTDYRKKQNQQTFLEILAVGVFKAAAGIFKLIFKGFAKKRNLTMAEKREVIRRRHQIEEMLNSNNIHELKQAVFEADKLVDYILKSYGYAGETFADRLRSAREYIDRSLYNQIWEGHKIRNLLAHEHELRIKSDELGRAAEKLLRYTKSV